MFAGISWGQFLLYVGLAVVLYYTGVLLVYFRRELSQLFASSRAKPVEKPRPPAETNPPVAVAVPGPAHSPIGASQDYGRHPFSPAPAAPVRQPVTLPTENPADAVAPAMAAPDEDDDDWFRVVEDQIPDPGEASYIIAGGIDLEQEFIGFAPGDASEVYEEEIPVEGLVSTMEVLSRDSVPEEKKAEVIRQASQLEGTALWESFLATKEGARERLEAWKQEARQVEDRAWLPDISHLPVPASQRDLFEDVDVDELINKVG